MFIAYGLHYTRSTEEMYIQNWNRIAIGINAEFDFHSMISSPARSLATHFNAMNHNRICLLTLQLPCYNNRSIQCTNCYIYLKYILHLNLFSTSSYGHQNRISSHLLFQQAQSISTWENWKQSGWNWQNQCFCYSGVKSWGSIQCRLSITPRQNHKSNIMTAYFCQSLKSHLWNFLIKR